MFWMNAENRSDDLLSLSNAVKAACWKGCAFLGRQLNFDHLSGHQ